MNRPIISRTDILAEVIHDNYTVLVVLERMGIRLGVGNKTIEEVAELNTINTGAFLLILNLFCNKNYSLEVSEEFNYIPDILTYLKSSHIFFLEKKIPSIQQDIQQLMHVLHDSKSKMVESFYNNYIDEVKEHIEYETETVFPYIEQLFSVFKSEGKQKMIPDNFNINIYEDHHDDIELVLKDLKNILIRHLPQNEQGGLRRVVLQELFELESDLFSHTRIEDEVLIPLVEKLEIKLKSLMTDD